MASEVYIKGKRVRPDPAASKGMGGEAEIFGLGRFYSDSRDIALKLYRTEYLNIDGTPNLHEQKGAEERLKTVQTKLRQFPKNLPPQVVSPIDFATNKNGDSIKGFTLEFLDGHNLLSQYSEKGFVASGGITPEQVCQVFMDLHAAICGVHKAGAVLGDFNDLNVLVKGTSARIIDADSMQFGKFYCTTFTQTFVDPTLCVPNPDPNMSGPILSKPHNENSDWYAFAVMLMQTLLFIKGGPYGGVYKPADKAKRLPPPDRWQRRVTVFDPEVVYPKPSVPMKVLPDELLHYWNQLFVKDQRGIFPEKFLNISWTQCSCGLRHARSVCPVCNTMAVTPVSTTQVTQVQGKVKVTTIFNKPGVVILYSTIQNGVLKYVYHDGTHYRREGETVVAPGKLDPHIRFRIQGDNTLLAKAGMLVTIRHGSVIDKVGLDSYVNLPLVDANSGNRFWVQGGNLLKNVEVLDSQASEQVGQVLSNQSLFWVGEKFGFGFYRAGEMTVGFTFDALHKGINDTVEIKIQGQLIDATCAFSDKLCWFFHTSKEGPKVINHCHVIGSDGKVAANVSAERGTEPWLDNLRGKWAFGTSLFVPTDEGLKRYDLKGSSIQQTVEYADTEKFLDSGDAVFLGKQGLYVVSGHEIRLLQIS